MLPPSGVLAETVTCCQALPDAHARPPRARAGAGGVRAGPPGHVGAAAVGGASGPAMPQVSAFGGEQESEGSITPVRERRVGKWRASGAGWGGVVRQDRPGAS